ncbi:MAG: stage II sporulation protein M [Candidatus Woesearchaeota archaeon]|nr:MAG: stage II sporulation protein M [Candidatus Woesearchaeota archaeon]
MVLETFISPFKAEKKPWELIFMGFLFVLVGSLLGVMIFPNDPSLVVVFLITLASVPLLFNLIKLEEKADVEGNTETEIMSHHARALFAYFALFLGFVLGFVFLFTFLPQSIADNIFQSQIEEYLVINGNVTGNATQSASADISRFFSILSNNLKVLVFSILFSFLYGAGAVFILAWNASVIAVAIGILVKTALAKIAITQGSAVFGGYFSTFFSPILHFAVHGVPEILSYMVAGLAGGIISVAVIRRDFAAGRLEKIIVDVADLLLLAFGLLIAAALLEAFVTPHLISLAV